MELGLKGVLKKRIVNRAPKTIEDVKNYVDIEWGTFDPEFIGNFTKSMRKRCDLVIAAQGKKIKCACIITNTLFMFRLVGSLNLGRNLNRTLYYTDKSVQ